MTRFIFLSTARAATDRRAASAMRWSGVTSRWPPALPMLASRCPSQLEPISSIPAHLKFNPYVLSGYRRPCGWLGCFRSLFYLHNETINIYTHLIPLVVLLANFDAIVAWNDFPSVSIWRKIFHGVTSVSPWLGSFLYHTFMCHQGGKKLYDGLLALDVLFIWIACVGATINVLLAGVSCLEAHQALAVLALYFVGKMICLKLAISATTPAGRALSFLCLMSLRWAVLVLRVTVNSGGHPDTPALIVAQDAFTIVAALVNVLFWPERFLDKSSSWGRVLDFVFNSHNLLHVLGVAGVYCCHNAVMLDFAWLEESQHCTNI